MDACKRIFRQFYWAYPALVLKLVIFYWQTDMLDMMSVYEAPLLSIFFLVGIFEFCSVRKGKASRIAFYILYTLVTLIMLADAAYSSYFGQYASVNQLYQLGSLGQIAGDGGVIGASVSPLCLLTLLDYPFVLFWFRRRSLETPGKALSFRRYVAKTFAVSALVIVFVCAWFYYGWNPQNLRQVQKVNHIEFFTYHTNDILVNVVGKFQRGEVDEEELQETIAANKPQSEGSDYAGAAQGKNLILIQVESLNDFVIGAEYNGEEITPNLNALLEEDTLYFNHFYSTTGVGNTCDAEFSVLNSLYPNDERECYRLYVDNTFEGLPWLLREQGYTAMAFHGYVKTFWNRSEAYKNQGFQRFYSEEDFEITEEAGFGLTDKEMFRQAVDILKEQEEPFFSFMITLTNHIPYELDDSLASLALKESDEGTTFGNYLRTVRYTDEAVGELIRLLKENGLYENTMIVLYGDHQGLNLETPAVKRSMTAYLGKEYDYDEMLNVPFLIHLPGLGESRTVTTVGGEVDVMPTLANLMGLTLSQPYVFGQDLLNADEGFIAQISYVGKGSFLTDDNNMLFVIGRDGSVENGRLLDLTDGSALNLNEALCTQYSERALALLDSCKEALDYNLIAEYVTH